MKYDVFISYRRGDKDGDTNFDSVTYLKSRIDRLLKGKTVYLDILGDPTGESIRQEILQHIRTSQIFVIVINQSWLDSIGRLNDPNDIVLEEIELALRLDLNILPLVMSDGRLPEAKELPESIEEIRDRQVTFVAKFESYERAIDFFVGIIKKKISSTTIKFLNWLAVSDSVNIVFGLGILGAVLLFSSRMLGIHLFTYAAEITAKLGEGSSFITTIDKEAGVLMALNWTLVIVVITPIMALLASSTLKIAKELLDDLQVRQMIFYVGSKGQHTPITSRKLWEAVIQPTSVWCKVFVVVGLVLSFIQWWQYSGQWYLKGFNLSNFMQESTGPDWHVAWALGLENFNESGLHITSFTLVMYLVYGLGSVITFSFYAFLLNFSSTLSNLASNVGSTAKEVLTLDTKDNVNGGLAAFERIQSKHAAFCYWSTAALYAMALRNAYLPLVCRIPESLSANSVAPEALLQQCSSMGGFLMLILLSFKQFLQSLFEGQIDLDILFFTYSEQNLFILGSLLHIFLIASFFYLISDRMKTIVESAQSTHRSKVASRLLRKLSLDNIKTLTILLTGAFSTVFLNLGPLLLFVVIILGIFHGVLNVFRRVVLKQNEQDKI